MAQQDIPVFLLTLTLLLFCRIHSVHATVSRSNSVGNIKRSDDSTLDDLKNVVQQQSAVIQQQSALIQTLQIKMTGVENEIATLQQRVAFTAHFNEGGPINIGTTAPIPFSHVTINVGNGYNPNSGVFTAPVSGVYLFLLHVKGDYTRKIIVEVEIVKSSTVLFLTGVHNELNTHAQTSASVAAHVNAGERVFVRHHSGPTTLDKWYDTAFSGFLLYAD
ncbi:hypothetical protein V1264_024360 [Littorina saxatilis]|uniref:C1q domain-containing protein n=1 Tax=Littorina saxatilis TaxID=31220 RepID=A0AAN9ALK8_9CAEN